MAEGGSGTSPATTEPTFEQLLEHVRSHPRYKAKDEGMQKRSKSSEVFEKCAGSIKAVLLSGIGSRAIDIDRLAKELCEAGVIANAELHQVEDMIKCDGIKVGAIVSACSQAIKRGKWPDTQLRKFIAVIEKYDHMKPIAKDIAKEMNMELHDTSDDGAVAIVSKHDEHGTSDDAGQSPAIEPYPDYAAKLREYYHKVDLEFLPLKLFDMDNKRMLTLTAQAKEEVQSTNSDDEITFSQFCSRLTKVNGERILIQGGPGYGKTSLSMQICKKWEEKLVLTNYLVIMLQLGKPHLQELKNKEKLFDLCCICATTTSSTTCTFFETYIDISNGRNVLFILEGYDELPNREEQALIDLLISGKIYPNATVMVTTRPWAVPLDAHFSQRYELAGHPRNVVKECIKECPHEIPYPIKALLSTPIFLKIIVDAYKDIKSWRPTSLFDVYVRMFLNEYLVGVTRQPKEQIPEEDEEFLSLAKMAAFMVIKNEYLQVPAKIVRAVITSGTEKLALHSSIQDFLAAYYVSRDSEHCSKFFKLLTHGQFSYFLIFLAGIIKHQHGKVDIEDLKDYFDSVTKKKPTGTFIYTMSIFCVLYELEDENIVKSIFKNRHIVIERTSPLPTPYDFFALGWCISTGENCTWELGFTIRYLLPEHLEALASSSSTSLEQISILNISLNPLAIEMEGLELVLKKMALESDTCKLKFLNVRGVGLEACDFIDINNMPHLEKLLIHDNYIEKGSHMPLIEAICKSKSLKEASFSNLDADECQKLLMNSQLKRLELWQLDSDSIMAMLKCKSCLEGLEIYQSEICPANIAHLSDALAKKYIGLKLLKFVNCNIDNATAKIIAEAVEHSPSLLCVSFDDNWIDDRAFSILTRITNGQRVKVKCFRERNQFQLRL